MFENTKRATIIRISKNIQHNGQTKKYKRKKQRSAKHTYKTKDRVTIIPLKTGMNSGVKLVTNPIINREWEYDREVFTTNWTYRWFITVNQVMVVTVTISKWWLNFTKRIPSFSSFLVSSILYQGNPDRSHNLRNILSSEIGILHMQVLLECFYI